VGLTGLIRGWFSRIDAIPAPGAWLYNLGPRYFLARPEREVARAIAASHPSGTLVDLGSGTGFLATEVAKLAPQAEVVGIDLSPEMVRSALAHARGLTNVEFRVGDVAALPLEGGSADFVFSTGAMHHWQDLPAAFAEVRRVLKPGAEAHIYDGCPEAIDANPEAARRYFGRLLVPLARAICAIHGSPAEHYRTTVRAAAEGAGFAGSIEIGFEDIWMRVILRKAT
jgi:ubiquinone/menaquinone biosynthesis C-methylase UbiE